MQKRRYPPLAFSKRVEFANKLTDSEYRESKIIEWIKELESKYVLDYTTTLSKKLKRIKTIDDIDKLSVNVNLERYLIDFNILGRYLASVELKTNYKAEFEDDNLWDMPFDEAIREMQKRKPTLYENIKDIEQKEKQNYFWIKKTTDLEITKSIHKKLLKSLEKGETQQDFLNSVKEYKLPNSYLKGVFRTVTTQAQQRGHLEQQLKAVDLGYEYGMFDGVQDDRQTNICKSLNGKVMKIKDFVEKGLYPPLHYQCRSSIIQLDEEDLKDMELSVSNIPENKEPFSDFKDDWAVNYEKVYNNKVKAYKNAKKYKEATEEIEKKLNERTDKIFKNKLTYSEINAINEYTDVYYGITNRYLRKSLLIDDDVEADNTEQRVKILDSLLSKNRLGENLILFRGVSYDEFNYWKESNIINTYKSSSINKQNFNYFGDGYKLIIKANKNLKGIYIGKYSNFENEKEFLIHRGQKYKIIKITNDTLEVEFI